MSPTEIGRLFTFHGSDKDNSHTYGQVYQDLIGPRLPNMSALLEIGVLGGASIRAWRDWLPRHCRVVGIDNNLTCPPVPGAELYQADSMDCASLDKVLGESVFDVIIDDGGHGLWEQQPTWENLYPRVKPGGYYVAEDLQHPEARLWFADKGAKIYSFNHISGRWDDVLAVIHKPID